MPSAAASKDPVFVLQISNGRFQLWRGKRIFGNCALHEAELAKLFERAGFDRDEHILMCGSSIDFPEDDGAPKNFPAHDVIERASAKNKAIPMPDEQDEGEPPWEIGKHDWRGRRCVLCGLRRETRMTDGRTIYILGIYGSVEEEVPTPCSPRLSKQIPGLWTSAEVCKEIGISSHVFKNRAHVRGFTPAAVLKHGNKYLWRRAHFALFAASDEEWNRFEHMAPEVRQRFGRVEHHWWLEC